jgi:hypothetical protein
VNPTVVIPGADALPLPAPVWLLKVLLLLTFFLHVVPMNLLLGGSLIALVERLRGGPETPAGRLARRLAKATPAVIAFTVTLGVAPLLFVQALYGHLFYTSSVIMAWPWLLVIPALIVVYYLAYWLSFRGERSGGAAGVVAWLLFLGAAGIAFVYANNMTLALRPEKWAHLWFREPGGMHGNLYDMTLYPRYLHFFTGAIGVAGLVVALVGSRLLRREPDDGRHMVRTGGSWFIAATTMQLAFGFWFLLSLPQEVMLLLLGRHVPATITLFAAILAAGGAVAAVATALGHPRPGSRLALAAIALAATLVGMIAVRDVVRDAMLAPHFDVTSLETDAQWGVFAVFVAVLVAGLIKVGWMVLAYARGKGVAGGA